MNYSEIPHTAVKLSEFCERFGLSRVGEDKAIRFQGKLSFEVPGSPEQVLTYISDSRYISPFVEKRFGAAIIPKTIDVEVLPKDRSYLIAECDPLEVFCKIHEYFVERNLYYRVDASVGNACRIAKTAAIHDGVKIGNKCVVDENVVVYPNTVIGDNVVIKANSVIGGNGFEIATFDGVKKSVRHCGGVLIEDNAEIGSCVTIDRSVRHGFTRVGIDTKVSNQVQIAHGAKIGSHCIVAGRVQIGNCVIRDGVKVGAAAAIRADLMIEAFAVIGIGAVVIKSVPRYGKMFGNPARRIGWSCVCGRELEFHRNRTSKCVCGKWYRREGDGIEETGDPAACCLES